MSEKLRKSIVFGLLIGALVLAYFHFGDREKKNRRQPARPAANVQPGTTHSHAIQSLPEEIARAYGELPWGKDPFYHSRQVVTAASRTDSD